MIPLIQLQLDMAENPMFPSKIRTMTLNRTGGIYRMYQIREYFIMHVVETMTSGQ